ncbi:MAG: bifunctional riboflavin kinase/FAD synthetase [Desulfovibrionaceae bacterium]
MIIARERSEITLDLASGSCVTIGNFDGVHMGHQKLIGRVVAMARTRGMKSVVVSFCPHPLRVLVGPHTPPFITVRDRKLDLLEGLGVDMVLLVNFTKELASMAPETFVEEYLVGWLNTRELVVGYDYSFGKGRKGNFELLKARGAVHGFGVEQLDPVIINGAIVSSTRIRDIIRAGDVWGVKPLLGRFYVVQGSVVHGKDRGGRLLGFPTANLELENELYPDNGVYAVWVQTEDGVRRRGMANIGSNPTFNNKDTTVEVHILDFDQDIYDQRLTVHFVQRLRDEMKFSGLDALIAQIKADIALGRTILDSPEAQL